MTTTKSWKVEGGALPPLAWHNRLVMWYTVSDLQNEMALASGDPDFDITKMPPELLEAIIERLTKDLDKDLVNSLISSIVKLAVYEVLYDHDEGEMTNSEG